MPWQLTAIRAGLRVLPPRMREKTAARLFMSQRRHPEPERERRLRAQGRPVMVAGQHALRFDGDGPTVLLMHGWEGRGLQLGAFVEALPGHDVFALDGPGHGPNDGIGALPTFTAFLEQAIEETRPALIIAHSLGSAAAIIAARRTGYTGRIVALGGPPETQQIFTRVRRFMGLPERGREHFLAALAQYFPGVDINDFGVEENAALWGGEILGVLAADDDDIPVEESRRIVEAAGGTVVVLDGVSHRGVMWQPSAVATVMEWLGQPMTAPPSD